MQIDNLIDHMNDHPQLARAPNAPEYDQDWEDLTAALNLLGNQRTKQQWIRVSNLTFTLSRKGTH